MGGAPRRIAVLVSIVIGLGISVVLFPGEPPADFREYYFAHRKWFFGLLVVTFGVDVVDTLLKVGEYFASLGVRYMVAIGVFVALFVTAAVSRNARTPLSPWEPVSTIELDLSSVPYDFVIQEECRFFMSASPLPQAEMNKMRASVYISERRSRPMATASVGAWPECGSRLEDGFIGYASGLLWDKRRPRGWRRLFPARVRLGAVVARDTWGSRWRSARSWR